MEKSTDWWYIIKRQNIQKNDREDKKNETFLAEGRSTEI